MGFFFKEIYILYYITGYLSESNQIINVTVLEKLILCVLDFST